MVLRLQHQNHIGQMFDLSGLIAKEFNVPSLTLRLMLTHLLMVRHLFVKVKSLVTLSEHIGAELFKNGTHYGMVIPKLVTYMYLFTQMMLPMTNGTLSHRGWALERLGC